MAKPCWEAVAPQAVIARAGGWAVAEVLLTLAAEESAGDQQGFII